ncbi:hypothetical protein FB451DRAFT_1454487 [Mycena latifolia]|nr:hypothetical protein FB451DRAFT_1454487 [Mycena latifolia]
MPPLAAQFVVDDFHDEENLAILRRCQRRITELEAQLEKEKGVKKAPASIKTFTNLGRCIHKVVVTFGTIDTLIAENDRRMDLELARIEGDDVHDEEEEHTVEQERAYNGYKELLRFVPALRKPLMEAEHDDLVEILNALRSGARNARSDDTKNLKTAIVPWLQKLFPEMAALELDSRDERGIYNDFIGALLCPTEYDFDDEEIRTRIREGDPEFLITANSWFKGLYPHKRFDPDNPDMGLFRNVMLLMVWKYIFTSPISVKTTVHEEAENIPPSASTTPPSASAAPPSALPPRLKKKKRAAPTTKRSVASIIGLKRVSGRSIAYAAVQYRVALSDTHHWDEHDGSFDYIQFYNNIVDYFEFPPGPVAKLEVARLLDWWNINVFDHCANYSLYEGGSASNSSVMRLKAIRQAREVGLTIVPA